MCLNPIKIRNPNKNALCQSNPLLTMYADCESQYVIVPCNNCSVCVHLRQQYFTQRVRMECLDNFVFFLTLTYDNSSLPSLTIKDRIIPTFDVSHIQNMFKRLRKYPDFPVKRYVCCFERGTNKHRPHYHLLLFVPKSYISNDIRSITVGDCNSLAYKLYDMFFLEWRRNVGSTRCPVYVKNFTFRQVGKFRNFDLTFVDTISNNSDNVSFYASKYMVKFDEFTNLLKSWVYFNSDNPISDWYKLKPRFLYSKGFGNILSPFVRDYIRNCIRLSLDAKLPYPCFFDNEGNSYPLSPYYRRRLVTKDEYLEFVANGKNSDSAFSMVTSQMLDFAEDYSPEELFRKESVFKDTCDFINQSNDFEDLFDY